MTSATPKTLNLFLKRGSDTCFTGSISIEGSSTKLVAEAQSGATSIRVEHLPITLANGDPLGVVTDLGVIRVYANGAHTVGQDAGQKHKEIAIQATNYHLPKDSKVFQFLDLSSDAVSLDYELRDGFYQGNEDNKKAAAVTILDDGSAAKRGTYELLIPRSTINDLAVSLTPDKYGNRTEDEWIKRELPKLTFADTTHTIRHEMTLIIDDKRQSLFRGVCPVADAIATGAN